MRTSDLLSLSARGLRQNLTRSLLTTLGIIIGIASVIIMLSLGKGAQGLILGQIASFGSDSIFIEPGGGGNGPPRFGSLTALKYDDYLVLRKLPYITAISPILYIDAQVNYGTENVNVTVNGSSADILVVNDAEVARGDFFSEADVESARNVAVLGKQTAEDLFDDVDPIGKTIRIKRRSFTVIGVLKEQGTVFFQNLDQNIYVPITTARRSLSGQDHLTFISGKTSLPVGEAKEEVKLVMRDLHGIDNPEDDLNIDDFNVSTAVEAADILGSVTTALTLFLTAVASISLIVGGIGIMNIMLVSVTERTREIGLRKAVGAHPRDILLQFLTESVFLTTAGGALGVLIGALLSLAASAIISQFQTGWTFIIPLDAVILSFSVAAVVGMLFGIYPAVRAARLNPIEALRYE